MKLKKIASLMLAGVMAASMLAGCQTTSNDQPTQLRSPPILLLVTLLFWRASCLLTLRIRLI